MQFFTLGQSILMCVTIESEMCKQMQLETDHTNDNTADMLIKVVMKDKLNVCPPHWHGYQKSERQ